MAPPTWISLLFLGLGVGLLAGCASGPHDLVAMVPPAAGAGGDDALALVGIRLAADRRPPEEHGTQRFPGRSYLGGNDLVEPTAVSVLRVLARDLVRSGVARAATLGPVTGERDYTLDVTVEHLAASYEDGVGSALLVVPTSPVEAVCELHVVLRDQAGRRFLERTFRSRKSGVAVPVSGLAAAAAEDLAGAVRAVVDEILAAIPPSIGAFWQRYRVSPPPAPRSSTGR